MNRSSLASLGVLVVLGGVALAEPSPGVISSFRGQFVVTKDDLPEGKTDGESIRKINAARLKTIEGEQNGDVEAWHFHYTAFLNRGGSTKLELEFLNEKNQLSANEQFTDVDPKNSVLSGDLSIDEDEGVSKGRTYTVELLAGNTIVSKTTLTMK